MIAYFVLGLALLAGVILLLRWFIDADPKRVVRIGAWVLGIVGVVLVVYFLVFGQRSLLFFALAFLLPLLFRFGQVWSRLKTLRGGTRGQTSSVTTRLIEMTLDHDSGAMSGVVREGRFAGRWLDQMTLEEQIDLWRDCAVDEQSQAVLEAYLDRRHGAEWRERAGAPGEEAEQGTAGAGRTAMTLEEAYEILGLQPGASDQEIRDAHHRLMRQYHPDRGGSNYLAAKINQAKELLTKRR